MVGRRTLITDADDDDDDDEKRNGNLIQSLIKSHVVQILSQSQVYI